MHWELVENPINPMKINAIFTLNQPEINDIMHNFNVECM